jgi:C4-dicarboxylate transporter DctM subunit
MLLALTAAVFVGLIALSLPIVFALGAAAVVGLVVGGDPLEMVASSMVAGSQNWVLQAIPSFIFAGTVMERCGMSNALVDLARALVGWLRGGLGMSVIVVSYFFSDICGSQHAPYYWPYVLALLIGLMLIICLPELSLAIPRSAGFVR